MAVRIAASDELHTSLAGASGAAALCFFPAGLSCILHGDLLGALVCLGIPLSGLAMARRLQKTAKPYKAILYPDSLELVEPGLPSTRVAWSQIAAVRWPQRTESPIILELTTEDGIAKNIRISLESIARQDRALFIAALHLAARQATQENWPLFCFKTAIPHLKYTDLTTAHCNSTNDSGGVWSMRLRTWFTKNPFWAGLLLPITAGCFVLPLVSRRTCWTVATLIASSAALNIRVVWGAWHQPFTNICLGFAAILFLCGAFAHARDSLEKEDSQAPYATAWLALFVLGAPFLGNAIVLKWLPEEVRWVILLLFFAQFAPILWTIRKRERELRIQACAQSPELEQWKRFEECLIPMPWGRSSMGISMADQTV